MSEEAVFRILFLVYYLLIALISLFFRKRARKSAQKSCPEEVKEASGRLLIRRVAGLLMILSAALYIVHPPFMRALGAPIPLWLRWFGVGLAALTIPLLIWVLRALGRQWSRRLELQQDHQLITEGPYSWVRHPMYVVIFLSMSCLALISANWLLIGLALLSILSIYSRIGQEEEMMLTQFPEEYRIYQENTGGLFPKLWLRISNR
jgi:protein-S-isoprenylcysteine O-methyltransferase Ste14